MRGVANLVIWFLIELSLIVLEFALYDAWGKPLVGPLIAGGVLTAAVTAIFGMAVFETIKHRHDKEDW